MVRRWTYYVACALLFLSLGTTAVAQTRAVNEHSKGDRLRSSSGKRVNGSGLRTTAYDGIHHLVGLHVDGGYSKMFGNMPQVSNRPGGYTLGLGLDYSYTGRGLIIQTGLAVRWQDVQNNVLNDSLVINQIKDSEGTPYRLKYDMTDRVDQARNLYIQLPIMAGRYFYGAYFLAIALGFSGKEAAAISIIGGADGPTSIFLAGKLGMGDTLLGPIAVAAYSYMSLVPVIQPPFMKMFTTEKERKIKMPAPRKVTKLEKILFPIVVTLVVVMILPTTAPLVGMLMLGNLFRESGVVKQLTETASNALMYIVVILLGTSVGATTSAEAFLQITTLKIVVLGLAAFCLGTLTGVLFGKLMCAVTKGKVNPLIGSAGVSAVPMAARVSQKVASEYDPTNFLLMNAMGPNVAGVIGTAVAAGTFMAIFNVH